MPRNFLFKPFALVRLALTELASPARAADAHDALDGQGRHVEVPGARIWLIDTGGKGQPLMLLHANTGTSSSWENQIGVFAKAGYRVIAPDRRGWGRSMADPATGPQPGTAADDLEAVVQQLGIARVHLVAVAGGGFVALDYAAWHRERLLSLTVGASTGSFQEPEIQEFIKRIEVPELRKQSPMYREVGASYRGSDPKGLERWLENEHNSRQKGATSQSLRSPNTYAKFAGVKMPPMLVMAGGSDLISPPGMMTVWAAHFKGAKYAVVADAGHSIPWENPQEFNRLVLGFLRTLRR